MSQPGQTTSPTLQNEIAELMGEISFQKVILQSIDDSVKNREAAEREVRGEIKALESKLRALRRGGTTASQSSSSHREIPSSSNASSETNTSYRSTYEEHSPAPDPTYCMSPPSICFFLVDCAAPSRD
jgi:chromosome segregation ATPase